MKGAQAVVPRGVRYRNTLPPKASENAPYIHVNPVTNSPGNEAPFVILAETQKKKTVVSPRAPR